MGFASPVFLTLFLPFTLLLCAAFRSRVHIQNLCLTVLSLLFYAWGEPVYLLVLVALAACNGALAKGIARGRGSARDLWTAVAIVLNIGVLFGFKYLGFFVATANAVFSLSLPVPQVALPLGISFFTFQALSYVLDVRMGKSAPAKDGGTLLLYLCLFPQLIAGPILRWHTVADQFQRRCMTMDGTALGIRRFILGLSKKVLLADVLGKVADAAFLCPGDALGAPLAWLGAASYTLQIYLDFSAYSDMAIGIGRVLGFTFPENFLHPLRAGSMQSFWRRWHITLTDWFRDYLYIPLGGNRKGRLRTYVNLSAVFLFTGLWHGARWTFVLWGAWNGLFVILERAGMLRAGTRRIGKWRSAVAHAYTLAVVLLGFVLFRAETVAQALAYGRSMFMQFAMTPLRASYLLEQCTPMNLAALGAAVAVSLNAFSRLRTRLAKQPLANAASYVLCCVLLLGCYAAIVASGHHPFIYFRF